MKLTYVDVVPVRGGKVDRIESTTRTRHIHSIEKRITSLLVECVLVVAVIVGATIGSVQLLIAIDRWSLTWAIAVAFFASYTMVASIPWLMDRLERRNQWISVNDYYWSIYELEKQFPVDG